MMPKTKQTCTTFVIIQPLYLEAILGEVMLALVRPNYIRLIFYELNSKITVLFLQAQIQLTQLLEKVINWAQLSVLTIISNIILPLRNLGHIKLNSKVELFYHLEKSNLNNNLTCTYSWGYIHTHTHTHTHTYIYIYVIDLQWSF